MKIINMYECEICGERYYEKSEAIKCETTHTLPCKVMVPGDYDPKHDLCHGYPFKIVVEMDNGDHVSYIYKDLLLRKGDA